MRHENWELSMKYGSEATINYKIAVGRSNYHTKNVTRLPVAQLLFDYYGEQECSFHCGIRLVPRLNLVLLRSRYPLKKPLFHNFNVLFLPSQICHSKSSCVRILIFLNFEDGENNC